MSYNRRYSAPYPYDLEHDLRQHVSPETLSTLLEVLKRYEAGAGLTYVDHKQLLEVCSNALALGKLEPEEAR